MAHVMLTKGWTKRRDVKTQLMHELTDPKEEVAMVTEVRRRLFSRRTTTIEVMEAGTVAGLIGGVVMAIVATTYAAAAGLGFFAPIQAIAATLIGSASAAEMGPVGATVLGVVIHLAVSIVFGIVFATLTPRDVPGAPAFVFGEFAGVVILVIMSLVVLPLVNPVVRSHLMWGTNPGTIPVWVAFAMHLAYGVGLSLAPRLRRHFAAP